MQILTHKSFRPRQIKVHTTKHHRFCTDEMFAVGNPSEKNKNKSSSFYGCAAESDSRDLGIRFVKSCLT